MKEAQFFVSFHSLFRKETNQEETKETKETIDQTLPGAST